MPMRVIGMLLGIPESEQISVRDANIRTKPDRWPEWDIDYDTAQLASTSTVSGWEKLRIVLP